MSDLTLSEKFINLQVAMDMMNQRITILADLIGDINARLKYDDLNEELIKRSIAIIKRVNL